MSCVAQTAVHLGITVVPGLEPNSFRGIGELCLVWLFLDEILVAAVIDIRAYHIRRTSKKKHGKKQFL